MLSNFSFNIDGYCSPEVNFEFTSSGTKTTTSGFEFEGYNYSFPSIYYTHSYDFKYGIYLGSVYKVMPGDDNVFTSVATTVSGILNTTSGTMYELHKQDNGNVDVIDLQYFSSFIYDSFGT